MRVLLRLRFVATHLNFLSANFFIFTVCGFSNHGELSGEMLSVSS